MCYCAIKGHKVFSGIAAPGNLRTFTCQDLKLGLVTVHSFGKSRRSGFFGILAFLGLAVCVFSWGLQYKLSLYDPPQAASHQIPSAKLLSKNEQSREMDSPRVVRTRTSAKVIYTAPTGIFLILMLVPSIMHLQTAGQRLKRVSGSRHPRRVFLSTPFVRPPPILV